MAKNDRAKEEKKAQRSAKRAQRKQTRSQMWQAFNIQRKQDNKLIPYMLLALLLPAVLLFLLGFVWGNKWLWLIIGLILGATLAMLVFSRRLQRSVYDRASGQAGAAGWALDNMRDGVGMKWVTKQGVQVNNHMDLVHRVVGTPGVVLVGEGEKQRIKPMMDKERRRLARIVGDTPIYEVVSGEGEDEVPIKKLQRHLMRLPRNIKKQEVDSLASRIESLDNVHGNMGMPKGPIPNQAKVQKGMNRRARRAAQRNKH